MASASVLSATKLSPSLANYDFMSTFTTLNVLFDVIAVPSHFAPKVTCRNISVLSVITIR